jgi:hypothetical protein
MNDALTGALLEVAEVLTTENALLAACDYRGVAGLLARKQLALERLSAARRSEANEGHTELARRVGTLTAENRRLLDRAVDVQRRVVDIICNAAREKLSSDRYGANGRRAAGASTALTFRVRA